MRTYLFTIMTIMVLLVTNSASGLGVDTTSADVPPDDGSYISFGRIKYSAINVTYDDRAELMTFTNIWRQTVGNDEHETFDAVFDANEIETGLGDITFTGPVEMIHYDRALGTTGLFEAEIVSMSLSSGDLMIREDPDRDSTGETDILDLGGGLYHIDSFFDVYTEFSDDGGSTWYDSDDSTRMYLVPEPATIILFSLGGLTLLCRRKA